MGCKITLQKYLRLFQLGPFVSVEVVGSASISAVYPESPAEQILTEYLWPCW